MTGDDHPRGRRRRAAALEHPGLALGDDDGDEAAVAGDQQAHGQDAGDEEAPQGDVRPSNVVVPPLEIPTRITSRISGKASVKTRARLLRPRRAARSGLRAGARFIAAHRSGRELEVDVLEGGPGTSSSASSSPCATAQPASAYRSAARSALDAEAPAGRHRRTRRRSSPGRSPGPGRRAGRTDPPPARSRAPSVARRALGDDSPVAQDDDAVGQALGLLEVVRGEHDRHAEVAQAGDDLPGLAARRGSKPVVGSSRNSSSGSPTSASATSSRRCWPPESVLAAASARSASPAQRERLVDVARRAVPARVAARGTRATVRLGLGRGLLQDDADALAPVAAARARGPRRARATSPPSAVRKPSRI